MCYECGETFHVRAKYEEHILLHQAILFCYQIFEFETAKATSPIETETDKNLKKTGLSRRNTFADLPRKRSNQFSEVTTAKRKPSYPLSKLEKTPCRKVSTASRGKDLRRKNSLSKSPSTHFLERPLKRKLITTTNTPSVSPSERKGCVGRPPKRKRGEPMEGAEIPRKVTRTDDLQKPRSDNVEDTIEASSSTTGDNFASPYPHPTAERGSSLQKTEGFVKDLLAEDKSADASSSTVSTASSSVTSSSSSSVFSSPSSLDSSSFSSPSSDSISYRRRRSFSRPKGVNKERDREYTKSKIISSIKREVRELNEESRITTVELKKDMLQVCQLKQAGIEAEKAEDTVPAENLFDEETYSGSAGEHARSKSMEKKHFDGLLLRDHFLKNENIEKTPVNGLNSSENCSKIKASSDRVFARESFLKENSEKSGNSVEISQAKGEDMKPSPRSSTSNVSSGQKCVACEFVSSQGSEMIEHVTRQHNASVVKLEKKDCVDGVWSECNEVEPNKKCDLCDRFFEKATDYFIHIIMCHKASLFAPKADRFTCTAHLAHPHLPTHKINITLKRPQV